MRPKIIVVSVFMDGKPLATWVRYPIEGVHTQTEVYSETQDDLNEAVTINSALLMDHVMYERASGLAEQEIEKMKRNHRKEDDDVPF